MERWELIPLKSIGKVEFGIAGVKIQKCTGCELCITAYKLPVGTTG